MPAAPQQGLDAIERQRSHLVVVLLLVTGGALLSMALLQVDGGDDLRGGTIGRSGALRWAPLLLVLGFAAYSVEQDRRLRRLTRALFDDRATIAQLAQETRTDPLTGLPNRKAFLEHLDEALDATGRTGASLAVLFVDLDAFKDVNDALGHPAGDALLEEVAARLVGCARAGDTVARLAGDEFAVLVEGAATPQQVFAVAERIRLALAAPVRLADGSVRISASAGVVLHAGGGRTSAELLRQADLAMYMAKLGGRNRWELFDMSVIREPQAHA